MAEHLHISDFKALHGWRDQVRNFLKPTVLPMVTFGFAELPPAENQLLSSRAARLQRACGCGTGGLFMTLAVIGMALSLAGSSTLIADVTLIGWLRYLLLIVASAGIGKLVGLIWARRQLWLLADSIAVRILGSPVLGGHLPSER
jgi:hypothetical protein